MQHAGTRVTDVLRNCGFFPSLLGCVHLLEKVVLLGGKIYPYCRRNSDTYQMLKEIAESFASGSVVPGLNGCYPITLYFAIFTSVSPKR